ncbi:hypothetical protein ACFQZC_03090 [Streptacidiphilus monticola]
MVVLALAAAVLPLTVGQARAALPGKAGPLLAGVVISGGHQGVATENVDGSHLVEFPGGGAGGLDQGRPRPGRRTAVG